MKTSISTAAFEKRISTPLFFLLLFAYQFLFTLQGVDFLDEGFSATFYQQFYNDPHSVQYNFLFWFSGLVGGSWAYLFPGTGLLGLRFLAIICTMSTIFMVWNLLKNYINRTHLKIGLALVTFAVCQNPKIFHYNFLSIVLYTGATSLLFNGLKKNNLLLLLFSGALVAFDAFSRIPSILNLGLVVVIAFYGFLYKKSIWHIIKQAFVFVVGFGIAVAAVLLLMKAMGHLEIYQGALRIAFNMGQSDAAAGSEYGFLKLLKQFFGSYNAALFFTLYILALILIAAVAPKYAKETFKLPDWVIILGKYFCLLMASVIMLKGLEILLRFYVGLTLITAVFILATSKSKEVKTLMLAGTYISLTYALGSSAGIFTAGVHIFWIALPIGIDFILSLKTLRINSVLSYKNDTNFTGDAVVSEPQFRNVKLYIIAISVLGCFYHQWFYPLHDEASRLGMRYSIDNKYVRGIYTLKGRADATNELLKQSAAYVKEGDYVLAFHSFPIYHFMTNTKPFAGNPMPWYFQPSAFREQLYRNVERTKILPVVIIQKVKTTPNDHAAWPDPWPADPIFFTEDKDPKTIKQTEVLQEFLDKYAYKGVWENDLFRIMVAGAAARN